MFSTKPLFGFAYFADFTYFMQITVFANGKLAQLCFADLLQRVLFDLGTHGITKMEEFPEKVQTDFHKRLQTVRVLYLIWVRKHTIPD